MTHDLHHEPWELDKDDKRVPDTLRTFIIFCEDEHHEPLYFKSFETVYADLKVNAIPNQRSKKLNLNATIGNCREKGLIEFVGGAYQVIPGTTENIWCVYDRDQKSEVWADNLPQDNIDFDTAIIVAENAGIKVAWSNDVFELWLLLHFEDVPTGTPLNRSYVYDRLTHIFKHVVPRNADLDAVTVHPLFNYKENMKRRERFITQVLPLLPSRSAIAAQRALALENAFGADVPYHEMNPCTKVHHLLQQLTGI
ncbi:RloB family protein [Mucilaginibacter flavidus]|uniref:RloB family protein n=1 Tax=Mucilaginibacter flavidus TaxID=2949309 RepID=UPI002092CA08|nr:RloB family protein [Mucilaginibacter flavidus]MCO5949847.1 RloB family protein [Mucilaginibacter flavidus]